MHIQHKRGTTAKVAAFKGESGEIVIDMEKKSIHIQDGITVGGHELVKKPKTGFGLQSPIIF